MKYLADLHIHSHYSRATSPKLDPEHLFIWAQRKGLQVVATGDISHPQWLAEMRKKMQPAENADGLFQLKEPLAKAVLAEVPSACRSSVHFILSGEISSIYKKDGEVHKVHNVVFFPSFESVQKFQDRLDRIGNIRSDGRPILGLDSRNLLEIVLETDPHGVLIPAHIWTPWFSLLGSQSGFDSVDACFDDLTSHIFALETGLSSDPPMNWRLSQLDRFNLISNSDAHSPEKLAREANVFDTSLSYDALFSALKDKNSPEFLGTLEFFPEEGKYHMDGHRKCNKMMRPPETIKNNGLCPACGKPAVLGVSYRVEELADRDEGFRPSNAKSFTSLVPLPEVLSEVMETGATSKRVQGLYESLLQKLGAELTILINHPLVEIEKAGGPLVAEAIRRMRTGQVDAQPGYDGEFGIIRLFKEDEREKILHAGSLFALSPTAQSKEISHEEKIKPPHTKKTTSLKVKETTAEYGLNNRQQEAVDHQGSPLIIQAGPGTGKTRTLTHWLANLFRRGHVSAHHALAITFTNKAAAEMRERLQILLGEETSQAMFLSTFHALGLKILRQTPKFFNRDASFRILNPENDQAFRSILQKKCGERIHGSDLERISLIKGRLFDPDNLPAHLVEQLGESFLNHFRHYEALLTEWNAVDLDDLISLPVRLLRNDPDLRRKLLQQFNVIAVDEFQDINQAQYEFFRIFALAAKEVCVIGDPDQAIYGFRGASARYFLQFQNDFPNALFLKLTQNYRSSQNILDASGQVLGHDNTDLHSDIHAEVKIQIIQVVSDRAEAELVVKKIEELLAGTSHFSMDSGRVQRGDAMHGYSFGDIAILLRSKNLLPPLIEALTRSGIPFETIQEQRLSDDPYVQLVLAVCSLYKNKTDKSLITFARHFLQNEPELMSRLDEQTAIRPDTAVFPESVGWHNMVRFYQLLQSWPKELTLQQLLALLQENLPLNNEEELTHKKLLLFAGSFGDRVQAFCDALLMQKGVDDWDEHSDRVRLLTLHSAKGLEFPVVFIIGCEEGIIPFAFGSKSADVEEEKRLFYVGMTRSKQRLYLTHAKTRMLQGQRHMQSPSRFLLSISDELLQKHRPEKKIKKGAGQLKFF